MIKTIIFDLDGTLYDESYPKAIAELFSSEYISKATGIAVAKVYEVFRKSKADVMKLSVDSISKNDRKKWFNETLRRLNITTIDGEEISRIYWDIVLKEISPYMDFLHILPWLKERYELCVLTDEMKEICIQKLQALKLEHEFSRIISSEQIGENKPSKKIFDYALSLISKQPTEVLMIGDNPTADILGGNRSGLKTGWLRRGKYYFHSQKEDEVPNIYFTNFIELPSKIEEIDR